MNDENEPSKPGLLYWLGIAVMLMLLLILCMVPVILIGMAFRPNVVIHFHSASASGSATPSHALPNPDVAPSPDLSGLRNVAEKAASNILPEPEPNLLNSSLLELKIRVPLHTSDSLQKARNEVLHILANNHKQFLETDNSNATQLIVTLKESDWNALVAQFGNLAIKDGYALSGVGEGIKSTGTQDVVGEIEIFIK
jgi:hypothetical protein